MQHFRTNGLLVEQGGLFELGTDESPMMEKATIYIKDPHDQPGGRGTLIEDVSLILSGHLFSTLF